MSSTTSYQTASMLLNIVMAKITSMCKVKKSSRKHLNFWVANFKWKSSKLFWTQMANSGLKMLGCLSLSFNKISIFKLPSQNHWCHNINSLLMALKRLTILTTWVFRLKRKKRLNPRKMLSLSCSPPNQFLKLSSLNQKTTLSSTITCCYQVGHLQPLLNYNKI